MEVNENRKLARANFLALCDNPYPGRGIIGGLNDSGSHLIQLYWIMGRSENSRNRVLSFDNDTGRLFTEAADPTKMKNPALVIYDAMQEKVPHYVVSNGDQTNTVMAVHSGATDLDRWLWGREYEPDTPNFTQRITAVTALRPGGGGYLEMSMLRKSRLDATQERVLHRYQTVTPGLGYCITTYSGDGNPLPSFRGDPLLVPLVGSPEMMLQAYWDALNEQNRISIAIKYIEMGNGRSDIIVMNKYKKAA